MAKKVIAQKSNERIVTASVSQHYEGPLPAPADFAAYKDALPSAPERILAMAEGEQNYRHKINKRVVNFGLVESILGMCFALIIVLVCIGAAVYLAMNGHEFVSCTLIGIIATLVAIFYLKKEPNK